MGGSRSMSPCLGKRDDQEEGSMGAIQQGGQLEIQVRQAVAQAGTPSTQQVCRRDVFITAIKPCQS